MSSREALAVVLARDVLYGRAEALAALRRRFVVGHRLVTILGPGGIGKTRLAKELAGQEDRALFIDLTEVTTRIELIEVLSLSLRARPADGADAIDAIADALAARGEGILVLDNFEQLVGESTVVADLIARTNVARFLVTTREVLRLKGEYVYELAPLGVPSESEEPRSQDAVLLFLHHYRTNNVARAPSAHDLRRIGAIVRRVEGIPLAIELCARQSGMLGLRAVEAGLDERTELTTTEVRGGPVRHRTMHAALEGSWHGLTESEQTVLRAAACFRGGFAPADMAAVSQCGDAMIRVLQVLREKSLLRVDSGGRFHLLVVIRDFVRSETDPQEESILEGRHARHFADLAEGATDSGAARALSEMEWGNLNAALEHSCRSPIAADAREKACSLLFLVADRKLRDSNMARLVELVDALLPAGQAGSLAPSIECKLWLLRTRAERRRARYERADQDLERAFALARRSGAPTLLARLMRSKSVWLARKGELGAARRLFERARKLSDPARTTSEGANDVLGLALALWQSSEFDAARSLLQRHIEHDVHPIDRALLTAELAMTEVQLNEPRLASARCEEARAILSEAGWHADALRAELILGLALFVDGHLELAEQRFLHVSTEADLLERRDLRGYAFGYLGALRFEQGQFDDAYESLDRGRSLVPDAGHQALFLSYRAGLEAKTKTLRQARRTLEEAEAMVAPPYLKEGIAAQWAHLELAKAREAAGQGDEVAARAALARAIAIMRETEHACAEAQLVRRAVLQQLHAQRAVLEELPEDLVIDPAGEWFRRGANPAVDCRRFRNARAALTILARHRKARAGHFLPWSELQAGMWPDESMSAEAGMNRMQVTLTRLRKMGLADVLIRSPHGCRIRDDVVVRSAGPDVPRHDAGQAARSRSGIHERRPSAGRSPRRSRPPRA